MKSVQIRPGTSRAAAARLVIRAPQAPLAPFAPPAANAEPEAAVASESLAPVPHSVRGTIVCGVNDSPAADAVLDVALALSRRLELRVVLVAIGEGIVDADGRPLESVTTRDARQGARRLLERLVQRHELRGSVECRYDVGRPAIGLARLAQEEGADLILIGARPARFRRGVLRASVLDELSAASPCPVVVVPPAT
jgi:nucleotide-binding universal stress UspA family protein